MDYLTIADIVEHSLPEEDMEIPEWQGTIKVRAITNDEFARIQRRTTNKGEMNSIMANAMVVEVGCVEPQFPPGQYRALMKRETGIISRISERILKLSGFRDDDEEVTLDELGEA